LTTCKKEPAKAPKVQKDTQRLQKSCKIIEMCEFYKLYEKLIAFEKEDREKLNNLCVIAKGASLF
jgi:hypothetical protein